MIARLLDVSPGKFLDKAEEYNKISEVFQKAGGSWEKLFLGSTDEMSLLRKTVKAAISTGIVSKKDVT